MSQLKGSNGKLAEVDDNNRLQTYATVQNLEQTLLFQGLLSSVFFQVTPAAANDYFFYIKNTGVVDIGFNFVAMSSTVATKVLIESVTGTPVYVAEADAEVTNLNLASPLSPAMDAIYDADITGLDRVGHLAMLEAAIDTINVSTALGGVIIPQGKAVAFKRVEATGLLTMNLSVGVLSF